MVLVLSGPSFGARRSRIADLAIQHRLRTIFTFRFYVEAGGLMSHGIDAVPMIRLATSYVAKILRNRPIYRSSNRAISSSHLT
jgi:putative ABC transport system substrate-binding protein